VKLWKDDTPKGIAGMAIFGSIGILLNAVMLGAFGTALIGAGVDGRPLGGAATGVAGITMLLGWSLFCTVTAVLRLHKAAVR